MGYKGKTERELRMTTFSQAQLTPLTDSFSKEGLITGLRLPSGQVMLNFESSSQQGLLKEIAEILGAELVVVKGTWTFVPATEDGENNG